VPNLPRINDYQQRTSPNVGVNLARANELDGVAQGAGAIGRAFGNVAQDILTVREFDRQQAEEKGAVWANEQSMNTRSAWTTKLPQMMDSAPEDGADFSKNVLSDFDSSTSEALKNAPTPQARVRLQQSLQMQRLQLQEQSEQFQREAGVKFKLKGTERALDGAMISARARPDDFQQLASEHDTAVQSAGFTPKVSADIREKSYRALAGAAVEGLIQRDPYKTLKDLNSEKPDNAAVRGLDFDQRDHFRLQAESEIREREAKAKHNEAEARQALADRQRDAISSYRMGLEFDNPPTRGDYVAALGADEGNKAYTNFTKEQQLGADVRSLALMPPDEQQKLIEARKPQGTEGAAEAGERYRLLTQQANYLQTLREKDPAAYVVQYSAPVQQAFKAAQASPAAAQQYATASIAEQKRLGITQPRVLPDDAASTIAQQFYAGNGEQVAGLVASEQQKWGSYWPQVFGELAAKKLPPAALAIGRGMEPGAAARLASASGVKIADLKNGIDVPPGDVKAKLNEHMSDFMNSLDGVVGAENTYTGMYDAAERLSYSYMRQGKSISAATDQAYREVLGDHYAFRQINGKTARIPIEQDSPDVERGAQIALTKIDERLKAPIPTSTSDEFTATDDLKRTIAKRGYWVTSADGENGLALFLDGAPVLKQDGSVYTKTWDQLRYIAGATSEQARQKQVDQAGVKGTSGLR
jgi:hypothetical protein